MFVSGFVILLLLYIAVKKMAESSESKLNIIPSGVLLVAGPSSSDQKHFSADLCFICQKKDQNAKVTHPGPDGKARLKSAATLRQYDVTKRLKLLKDEGLSY